MKDILKIILLIFGLFYSIVQGAFLIFGPDYKRGEYTMTYKVYYSNEPKTYTITNDLPIYLKSYKGSNYLYKTIDSPVFYKAYISETVLESSAPIEIASYKFKEKNYE